MRHRYAATLLVVSAACVGCGGKDFPYRALTRPATAVFPAPPSGSLVFSRQDGRRVLALAVVRGSGTYGLMIRVSVVGPRGRGVPGLAVRLTSAGFGRRAVPCGIGCYEARLPRGLPRSVDVQVAGGAPRARWHVELPSKWPAPDASALMARAERVWRRLRSLSFRDRLATDAAHSVSTTWRIVAPDRVAYAVDGGGDAIIIGRRRWDLRPRGRWTASRQDPPLSQPVPLWVEVADAHVLGTVTLDGRPAWRVTFFDPKTPAWFEAEIDKQTGHTVELWMNTTAHFMHERYRSFDAPIEIRPPRSRGR